ncbi:UNVERIFIED_CONTAM: hypothetical protein PYX00_005831 [Menopon gallinae]|uniref:Uncharacterized protein n=1 Tax=Menopon gallinae TaxID=328185 RepID=A0AAW2HU94_9NEOP
MMSQNAMLGAMSQERTKILKVNPIYIRQTRFTARGFPDLKGKKLSAVDQKLKIFLEELYRFVCKYCCWTIRRRPAWARSVWR